MVADRLRLARRLVRSFVLLLAVTAALPAQDGSIRGSVFDKDFDVPVRNAQVHILELRLKTTTSDTGNYVFSAVPKGTYTLQFRKAGYKRQLRGGVVVRPGRLTAVDMTLEAEVHDLGTEDVPKAFSLSEGDISDLEIQSLATQIMTVVGRDMMRRIPHSDVSGVLNTISGASVKDGKSAVIRGLPDRYVSSQLNKMRLPSTDEDKRAVELDQFPTAVVERVEVSKTFSPDQQGDASGGAVNIHLRGVPNEKFLFTWKTQAGRNSQAAGRGRFLTYDGGGVSFWGKDGGRRGIQTDNIGGNWDGAVGTSEGEAPVEYKLQSSIGGYHDLGGNWKIGGFASVIYERDVNFYDNGIDDSRWVEGPGKKMTPKSFQGQPKDGDFRTGLFDITRGSQAVKYGGLATVGIGNENHSLNLSYLYNRIAQDVATLAEDTRGKAHYFPGHNPDDPTSPGHSEPDAAPYLRLETLEYTERTTTSLQFHGKHALPFKWKRIQEPQLDWAVARSKADLDQPDKRQFGEEWFPGRSAGPFTVPPIHGGFKPAANFTLGNVQRLYKKITEDSDQYLANLKFPFLGPDKREGFVKFGVFEDKLDRRFDQESFSNFGDNSTWSAPWRQHWSRQFRFENHPITESTLDVDYKGELNVSAHYGMVDLPFSKWAALVGGFRIETTEIGIVNDAEKDAVWFPPGSITQTQLNPGDADVTYKEEDVLPSATLILDPHESVKMRFAYNKTIARQTFKELSPILQQEYLGGPIFIGNPTLAQSKLRNYDARIDYEPWAGSLFSASYFLKKLDRPIEYVLRVGAFDYTTAVNYPKGEMSGWEFEVRQSLRDLLPDSYRFTRGFGVGANATFIDSEVMLDPEEAAGFNLPNIQAPMDRRHMTNAPERLFNVFLTYDNTFLNEDWGTTVGVFYTIQGDTLLAGAGQSNGNFVPSIYQTERADLSATFRQRLGRHLRFEIKARNLLNAEQETVYRSPYIGGDVLRSNFTKGIDYSIAIGGEIRF